MIPSMALKLDKVYNLRFGMGAQVEFEQLTGRRLNALLKELQTDPSMETVATALWIMMKRENKELTLEKVYEIVDDNSSLLDVSKSVIEAITAAWEVKLPNDHKPKKK